MKRNNMEYRIVSPKEYQWELEKGKFACMTVKNSFQRLRATVILSRELEKAFGKKNMPAIAYSHNMMVAGEDSPLFSELDPNDQYVILIQGEKNTDCPAVRKAKEKIKSPWWKFHGTAAALSGIFADLNDFFGGGDENDH